MFLYRFVPRRHRMQTFVHAITCEQPFGFLSILAGLMDLTYRLPDLIFVYFRRHIDLEFSWSNMEFAISAKNGPIVTKQKANILIEIYASDATIGFDLGLALDLEFSRSNMEFAISQPTMARLPRNETQTYRLNSMPQMWPWDLILVMTLTLNFQREIEFAIS